MEHGEPDRNGESGPASAHLTDDPAQIEDGVCAYFEERYGSIEPYESQSESFVWIANEVSVVLRTPTGSGKSEVALAAHFAALCRGQRSVYTAPIKALVNEKFFDLCRHFGSAHVGLMTGDATVNREAPILCCTAEILAKLVVQGGPESRFRWVVMDEFHYFGSRERGMAWLIPLVEMRDTRFVLISATLRDPKKLTSNLEEWSGADAVLVSQSERPVPLHEEFKELLVFEAVQQVLEEHKDPAYVVSFGRRAAARMAGQLQSSVKFPDELKQTLKAGAHLRDAVLRETSFETPFGKRLYKLLRAGIGVHHGGMLPKYRRVVERLSKVRETGEQEKRALALICGTNTLGVGVDLPIQTVVLTALTVFKQGETQRLAAQEYQQLIGRAGRKGQHEAGYAWVLAPEHEVKNERAKRKAAGGGKKLKLIPQPPGFQGWSEKTMQNLSAAPPSHLVSRVRLDPRFVLGFRERGGDGLEQLQSFLRRAKLRPEEQAAYLKQADETYRQLDEAEVSIDLERTLDRPLGPFLDFALARLPEEDADVLDLLAVVESVLEAPRETLKIQQRQAQDRAFLAARDDGVTGYALTDAKDEANRPRPLAEWLEATFESWLAEHPYLRPVDDSQPDPRSVVAEMFESGFDFNEYIRACNYTRKQGEKRLRVDLTDFEGELLYYLSTVHRTLVRHVQPDHGEREGLTELVDWLGLIIAQIDTSLVDEWARLDQLAEAAPESAAPLELVPDDVTHKPVLFRRLVRAQLLRWVRVLASRDVHRLPEMASEAFTVARITAALEPYWERHDYMPAGPEAGNPELFAYEERAEEVEQTLPDPEDEREWRLRARVDLAASAERGDAVLELVEIAALGELSAADEDPEDA
jgi:hypothetical protein